MEELYGITDMIKDIQKHGLLAEYEYIQDAHVYTIIAYTGIWYTTRMVSEYRPFSDPNRTSILAHNTERHVAVETIIKEYEHFMQKEKEKEMKSARTEQKFTRDDLKPGYIIMLRNGTLLSIQMVGKETLIATAGMDDPNWRYLSNGWDSQLNSTERGGKTFPSIVYDKTKDIVAVYGYVQGTINYSRCGEISSCHRPLLWSRYEAKKMTVEEIEKALGYKVEIVSD